MTYTDGQRLDRSQVEPWIAEQYPNAPYFLARVTEREMPGHPDQVHVTVRITDNNGGTIVNQLAVNGEAVYHSTRPAAVMLPQVEAIQVA